MRISFSFFPRFPPRPQPNLPTDGKLRSVWFCLRRLFLILSLVGLRELIFNSVSTSMKNGIAAGIGVFIAFIGLQQAGIIIKDPPSAVKLNTHFASPDFIVFFIVRCDLHLDWRVRASRSYARQ